MDKRLKKSEDRIISGVCGGIAEYLCLDPTLVRIGYACLTLFSAGFPGILLYIICMIVMPKSDNNYLK